MNRDVPRALPDELREALTDVRVFKLKEGGGYQRKSPALADSPRRFAHVLVGFMATAAVPDNQHSASQFLIHAYTSAACPAVPNVSNSSTV
jgi:hypothetical protein